MNFESKQTHAEKLDRAERESAIFPYALEADGLKQGLNESAEAYLLRLQTLFKKGA